MISSPMLGPAGFAMSNSFGLNTSWARKVIVVTLPRSRHHQLREPVHPPSLLALDPPRRFEALRLTGKPDRITGSVKRRDRAGRRLTGNETLPARPHVVT